MQDFQGKTAFVTGGASGIGFAMAKAFGAAGMNVMLADIEREPLEKALEDLRQRQIKAEGVHCDVAERASVEDAAKATVEAFGKVHVVCNNAGVGAGGPVGTLKPGDWDWTIGVNLMGVVYGVEAFLPLIRAHGEGGHFVNTASMAGMISPPGMEPYCATKFAVVAMSEGWAGQLAPENIGVSVLCPGFVNTRIFESSRTRQEKFGKAEVVDNEMPSAGAQLVKAGINPDIVGACVFEAVRDNDLYIFTHPDMRPAVEQRFARIMAGFDKAAQREALRGVDTKSPQVINMLNG
ncbi:MAG: SDR family NAD(P)-dependent oxidoreductase [Parvibaculum sp.]|uniref:SDR family NAD(P)-dependent oxidoreductase n=1 Tax=Parvibaculum sp. TaxID=2024848 RepID=UPI0025FEB4D2|nr:SDR family NAD(P)-dependent oxidoreductase [Parvibaculum sp.]MCE9649547.1 SDR family NAD(P)-dependent oxidoreductase [Parvibaculum sp.]